MSDLPSWCRAGQRVVCVNVKPVGQFYSGASLEVGRQYIIRDVTIGPVTGLASIALIEIVNEGGYGPYWHYDQFRPLVADDNEIEATLYNSKKRKHLQRIPHHGTVS